ncbi:MFS transporter [Streptomyces sp. HNM0645]|uniref:MFS transporter n=1 Tax=Streptomyces sp. HNM0645 TaxID=2782343 RepID=UPI0024B86698|nr:MFS transporter [Streptomyces sp. HNM0645]MDI9883702.1 MFS transporter [Streptomyces sp. HNM0645]
MRWRLPLGPSRNFRLLWFSVVVSGLGDGMRYVALPLLASHLTSDPRKIALVFLADQLPWPLVMVAAGVTADRFDRRRIMVALDSARVLVAAWLAVTVGLEHVTLAVICIATALLDLGQRFYLGAAAGIVPMTVQRLERDRANAALAGGSVTATLLLGNPLGALLFDMHPVLPFGIDALSFLCSAVLIFSIRGRFRAERPPETTGPVGHLVRRQFTDGLRALWKQPLLRRITLLSALYDMVGMSQVAIGILFARTELGLSDTGFGLLVATFGLGALIGSVLVGRWANRFGRERLLLGSLVIAAVASLGVGLVDAWLPAGVFVLLYGASATAWRVNATTVRQNLTPNRLLGRVTMTQKLLVRCGAIVGTVLGGLVAHHFGLRTVFHVGTVLLLAGVVAGGRRLVAGS